MEESNNELIREFDQEVETRIQTIRDNMQRTVEKMRDALDMSLYLIPDNVKKMKMKTLLDKYNGDITKASAGVVVPSTPKTPKTPKSTKTPTSSKKRTTTPKGTKNVPLSQTASASDLLNMRNTQDSGRKTPTKKTGLPPRPPTPKTLRTASRIPGSPRR